jgi:hypothetical protein
MKNLLQIQSYTTNVVGTSIYFIERLISQASEEDKEELYEMYEKLKSDLGVFQRELFKMTKQKAKGV